MSGISIRTATEDDWPAVGALTLDGFGNRGGDTAESIGADRRQMYLDVRARAESGLVLVAVDDASGAIVGTVSLLRAGSPLSEVARTGMAELRFVTVDSRYRGHGIAERLVSEAIVRARQWEMTALALRAREQDIGSQRVYQRQGFIRNRALERTQQPGVDRTRVFVRPLGAVTHVMIRRVREDEHEALVYMLLASYGGDYPLNEGYARDIADLASRVREHDVWVAVSGNGEIVGTVTTPAPGKALTQLAGEKEMDFRLLAVSHRARGMRIGSQLVEWVCDLARQRGAHTVVLSTGPEMTGAHKLYERLGFESRKDREYRIPEGVLLRVFTKEIEKSST